MAETHKEIVKVWIAPGCIVCDACETDCPEVFDVQEETCVIRPPALKAEFTRPLTPSIIIASEGCPVDVIKFDTIEVEGPEPESWKAQWEGGTVGAGAPAGGGAGAGGGGAGIRGATISREPPDPKWMTLLEAAHVSGSRSSGGPKTMIEKAARVPAEAIKSALPLGAPPDAQFATMVGTGFVRPGKSVADRIREAAAAKAGQAGMTRRGFAGLVIGGWAALSFISLTSLAWFQSFMIPKAPIKPPTIYRCGNSANYMQIGVNEDYKPDHIWLVTLEDEGVKKLVALNTVCTHLGCIPNWLPGPQIFKCPCHGSGYRMTGVNFEGPAPRPLERWALDLDDTGSVIVDQSRKFRYELGQWSDPAAWIKLS